MKGTTAAIAATILMVSPAAAEGPVDLALVLAVDVSGSVNRQEYELQTHGIAAAFRRPDIVAAIRAGRHGRIAVNLMSWGDPDYEKLVTGWYSINDTASADSFADMAQGFEGRTGGGTGIGVAIGYGITLIETSGFDPVRKVIDVSGDGTEMGEIRDPHFTVSHAKALREARGVVVNGLAIRNDVPDLDEYYRAYVAGGPGSFVISINAYSDYAEAIHRKLLREILPPTAQQNLELPAGKLAAMAPASR